MGIGLILPKFMEDRLKLKGKVSRIQNISLLLVSRSQPMEMASDIANMKHVRHVEKLYMGNVAPNGSLRGATHTLDIFVFHCDKEKSCDRVRKYTEDNSMY